ncbi:MAG: methylmalonyl-CoA epimerase [Chlorobi bacterium]|nr:methylmalonyl-CoA epimerase [Chlorobiota bacterium]
MTEKIEHIGIAVADLDRATELYTRLLGIPPYKTERVESEGVEVAFFRVGQSKIELLAPLHEASPIAKFLAKRGEGIHHVAFGVSDIRAELQRLKAEGFELLNENPKPGADRKWVAFVHPKSAGGVLVELCQDREKDDDHGG